jgi:hypothetical protein
MDRTATEVQVHKLTETNDGRQFTWWTWWT